MTGCVVRSELQSVEERRGGQRFQFLRHIQDARLFRQHRIGQTMHFPRPDRLAGKGDDFALGPGTRQRRRRRLTISVNQHLRKSWRLILCRQFWKRWGFRGRGFWLRSGGVRCEIAGLGTGNFGSGHLLSAGLLSARNTGCNELFHLLRVRRRAGY